MKIKFAIDFSHIPKGRYRNDGDVSGEAFREDHLLPNLNTATKDNPLIINLDGAEGYPGHFLEEAFGGLVRNKHFTKETLTQNLIIEATSGWIVYKDMIWEYIDEAHKALESNKNLNKDNNNKTMGLKLNIAKEWCAIPMGTYRHESETSGQTFREDMLHPRILNAIEKKTTLEIDLTGFLNVGPAFMEEAFGGLVRNHGLTADTILKTIKFFPKNSEYNYAIDSVKRHIIDADKALHGKKKEKKEKGLTKEDFGRYYS